MCLTKLNVAGLEQHSLEPVQTRQLYSIVDLAVSSCFAGQCLANTPNVKLISSNSHDARQLNRGGHVES